jgi:hypothetical protein
LISAHLHLDPSDVETSALRTDSESNGETPDALAKVSPETELASEEEEATPAETEPAANAHERKAKPKGQAKVPPKVAKPAPRVVRPSPQKKPLFARGKVLQALSGWTHGEHKPARIVVELNAPH